MNPDALWLCETKKVTVMSPRGYDSNLCGLARPLCYLHCWQDSTKYKHMLFSIQQVEADTGSIPAYHFL